MNSDLNAIGQAIGRIPSGCAVLTAEHEGKSTGLLVSWVQQAGFEPPAITACLKKERPAITLVDGSGRFALNLMGEKPTALLRHFVKGFDLSADAFAGLTVAPSDYGPLIEGCVAHMGCRVREKVDAGDHFVYVAEVKAGSANVAAPPHVHVRHSGLSY